MSPVCPSNPSNTSRLQQLIQTYFNNPEKRIKLNKGERLMKQGEPNNRLYLVREGGLAGRLSEPDGAVIEPFKAGPNQFVGVNSFFSESGISFTDVIAEADSEVAYMDQEDAAQAAQQGDSIAEQFMPIIVQELLSRQQYIQKISREKEQALKTLIEKEKLASLGQIAAGIAHELNNAVAVLLRNTQWLGEQLNERVRRHEPAAMPLFEWGWQQGHHLSTREVRRRSQEIAKRFNLAPHLAETFAASGADDDAIRQWLNNKKLTPQQAAEAWELGAVLNHTRLAAEHAQHVVKSVKALGAAQSGHETGVNVNDCLREAQTLLSSPLRQVNVVEEFGELPPITANRGELVQIGINLMNNACEAMQGAKIAQPELRLRTFVEADCLVMQVQDNGPGIPESIRPTLFQPRITTKTGGGAIGLGLGLTIVHRIVESHAGRIDYESQAGRTVFTVRIPMKGGKHE